MVFQNRGCLRAGRLTASRLPAGRIVLPRPTLPAGRDFGPVRTSGAFPPTAARRAPHVHEATGGYAVRSPCPSGIPRTRHKALSMVLQRFLSLVLHRFLISGPDLRIDVGFCLFMHSCVHRFLISGPDLGIDARFSPFTRSCVHRFLISSPDLGIDAKKPSRTAQRLHRFLISWPNLGIDAAPSLLHRRMALLRNVPAATTLRVRF